MRRGDSWQSPPSRRPRVRAQTEGRAGDGSEAWALAELHTPRCVQKSSGTPLYATLAPGSLTSLEQPSLENSRGKSLLKTLCFGMRADKTLQGNPETPLPPTLERLERFECTVSASRAVAPCKPPAGQPAPSHPALQAAAQAHAAPGHRQFPPHKVSPTDAVPPTAALQRYHGAGRWSGVTQEASGLERLHVSRPREGANGAPSVEPNSARPGLEAPRPAGAAYWEWRKGGGGEEGEERQRRRGRGGKGKTEHVENEQNEERGAENDEWQ